MVFFWKRMCPRHCSWERTRGDAEVCDRMCTHSHAWAVYTLTFTVSSIPALARNQCHSAHPHVRIASPDWYSGIFTNCVWTLPAPTFPVPRILSQFLLHLFCVSSIRSCLCVYTQTIDLSMLKSLPAPLSLIPHWSGIIELFPWSFSLPERSKLLFLKQETRTYR